MKSKSQEEATVNEREELNEWVNQVGGGGEEMMSFASSVGGFIINLFPSISTH